MLCESYRLAYRAIAMRGLSEKCISFFQGVGNAIMGVDNCLRRTPIFFSVWACLRAHTSSYPPVRNRDCYETG